MSRTIALLMFLAPLVLLWAGFVFLLFWIIP